MRDSVHAIGELSQRKVSGSADGRNVIPRGAVMAGKRKNLRPLRAFLSDAVSFGGRLIRRRRTDLIASGATCRYNQAVGGT